MAEMRNILRLISFSYLVFTIGCSSHKIERPIAGQSDLAKDSLDNTKTPARMKRETQVVGNLSNPYFAGIQILSEVVQKEGCTDAQSLQNMIEEDPVAELSATNQIRLHTNSDSKISSIFNIQLRSLGFDHLRYKLSLVNGSSDTSLPYSISLQALPNGEVEFQYLDQSIRLELNRTPVYTLTAEEKRGDCILQHNVNIFGEKAGRYPVEGAEKQ